MKKVKEVLAQMEKDMRDYETSQIKVDTSGHDEARKETKKKTTKKKK